MAESNFTRICTCCKTEFPANLDYFPPQRQGKYGLYSACRPCKKKTDAERRARPDQLARQQAWRDANKPAVKAANAKYRADGYSSTEASRAWRNKNIEAVRASERDKQRRLRSADVVKARAKAMERYYKNHDRVLELARAGNARRYREVEWFNLRVKIGSRLTKMLRGTGGKGARGTEEILGYTRFDLISHIERQFSPGMSWDRVMSGEIHIDHIRPVASFKAIAVDSEEFRACWALSNLQPLWADDNRRKRDKVLHLI